MMQQSVRDIETADTDKMHSPEKCVRPVVEDFALRVSPVQTLSGGLLHHLGFYWCDLIRTTWLHWAVVNLLGGGSSCGALAGGADRGHAAFLWLRFGHGFGDQPPFQGSNNVLCGSAYALWGSAPAYCPRQPHPIDSRQHPGVVEDNAR